MNKGVMFSHKTDDWKTPKSLYEKYSDCFDPCPYKADFDGLLIPWKKRNFVNPPYSNIAAFVDKTLDEAAKGNTTFLLVPARTDTRWFHKILDSRCYFVLNFIKGRLHFNDTKNAAPFPSILIEIRGEILYE